MGRPAAGREPGVELGLPGRAEVDEPGEFVRDPGHAGASPDSGTLEAAVEHTAIPGCSSEAVCPTAASPGWRPGRARCVADIRCLQKHGRALPSPGTGNC